MDNSTNRTPYVAHIRARDKEIQTVAEHLKAVQAGCEAYGTTIGVSHVAGLAGLLHDLGKNTTAFQTYIRAAVEHPDKPPRKGSVDHSTAGGRFLYRRYHGDASTAADKITAEWVANCIISHHQGLRDYLDPDLHLPFFERVARKTEGMEEYDVAEAALWTAWTPEKLDRYFAQARQEVMHILHVIRPYPPKMKSIMGALLIKYVFSCLIDADRTNTQQFEDNHNEPWTHSRQDFFKQSYDRLITALRDLERSDDAKRPINQLRRNMSRQCDDFAIHRPPGIYTLSIPTGGGKTLASFRYALQHALQYKKERIIYVVP